MRHHVCVYFVRFERYDRQSRAQRHMSRGRGREGPRVSLVPCERERCKAGVGGAQFGVLRDKVVFCGGLFLVAFLDV